MKGAFGRKVSKVPHDPSITAQRNYLLPRSPIWSRSCSPTGQSPKLKHKTEKRQEKAQKQQQQQQQQTQQKKHLSLSIAGPVIRTNGSESLKVGTAYSSLYGKINSPRLDRQPTKSLDRTPPTSDTTGALEHEKWEIKQQAGALTTAFDQGLGHFTKDTEVLGNWDKMLQRLIGTPLLDPWNLVENNKEEGLKGGGRMVLPNEAQIIFENAKIDGKTAAKLVAKLISLGVEASLMTAQFATGLPFMIAYREIRKTIEAHAKNLNGNEVMAANSIKLIEHVNYIIESLRGAEFPEDCPAFVDCIERLMDLCETVANWNGYSSSKKKYAILSFDSGTTLAAKYNTKFHVQMAMVRESLDQLLQSTTAKSFAKLEELTVVVKEGIGALHDDHVAVNLSVAELKVKVGEASIALKNFEESLDKKLDDIKDGQDEIKEELKAGNEDIKAGQDEIKEELKAGKVEVKELAEMIRQTLASPAVLRRASSMKAGAPGTDANSSLADISTTVPDLPVAYMFREGDIKGLKDAVLREGNNTPALTSTKKRQKLTNKIGAHGMGGVGKTTIAIALVHDAEVRTFFDLIVWVSVGQEPDIMELQSSIHWQLTKTDLESGLANHKRVEALRSAGKGRRLLLVVDDMWDASYEKDLNCIDLDTPSKLLVTTRIRGLLKNTSEVEVGVLSQDDARTLLLSAGEMEEDELDKDAYRQANAVVELCGRLPLTLAIAGGMIACNFGLSDDIIEVMKEGHLREQDDEEGLTLEGRIIQSSLTMLKKGKNSDMTLKVFFHFAVFPEDVLVPVDVFFKLASYISGEKNENKARIMVGGCLKELLKYNLIKGSLRVGGDGAVFMHDLVRDFAISRHTDAELHTLHQNSIEVFLGERPLPDGFPIASHASSNTYVGYLARHAHVHMRGALRREKEDTLEEPPDAWLAHPDTAIKTNTAMAVGLATLEVLSEAREAEGELVRAAQAVWAASLLHDIRRSAFNDLVHRAAALLERADDMDAKEFELEVLSVAFLADMGTKRNGKAVDRQQALAASSKATFDSRTGEAMAVFMDGMAKMGFLGGEGSIEAALPSFLAHARIVAESKDLAPNKSLQVLCTTWYPAHVIGMAFSASPFEPWHDFGFSEEKLVSGIDFYNFHVCGRILKEQFVKMDSFRYGALTLPLALLYGNLDALDVWYSKTLAASQEIDLPTSKDYASEILEVAHCLLWCAVPLFVLLRQFANASKLLKAGGFTWSEDGFENFDKWFNAFSAMFPFAQKPNWDLYIRLTIIVTSPSGVIDEVGVKAQIPSPAQITEMERGDNFFRRYGFFDLTSLGALAFLKLGRDDDAYELARLAAAPEQNTEKKPTLVGCYSILGQVAAKRKHPDEADGHFKRALEEAKLSGLPMLEVLAARDWKRVLQAEGRDCSAMEAVIDVACGKMGKSRVQLGSDLVGLRALKGQSI